jgi:hypothetical protein
MYEGAQDKIVIEYAKYRRIQRIPRNLAPKFKLQEKTFPFSPSKRARFGNTKDKRAVSREMKAWMVHSKPFISSER